jgi:hypothetical protein
MFGKASKSTIEKSLPALPTPPYCIISEQLQKTFLIIKLD